MPPSGERNDDERISEQRKVARRERRARRGQGASRAFVGRADRALASQFRHRGRAASLGPAGDPGLWPSEEMRGAGQSRTRPVAEGQGRSHRPGRPGRDRRQARRRVPAGRVSDRLGHPVQHERQRSDRQPGDPDRRRRSRIEEADPSERRRQSQSVLERRVPDRHAYRGGRADQDGAATGRLPVARYAATPRRRPFPIS